MGGQAMGKWQRLIVWLRGDGVARVFDWQPLCFVPEGRRDGTPGQ
jgi:hypothetical protein